MYRIGIGELVICGGLVLVPMVVITVVVLLVVRARKKPGEPPTGGH